MAQQFQRCWIDPVEVLINDQYRLMCREALQLVEKSAQRPLLPALRGHLGQPIALAPRVGEKCGKQRDVLVKVGVRLRQHGVQLVEPDFGAVVTFDAGSMSELSYMGIEGAVLIWGEQK
jgi:hypothetical protein